MEITIETRGLEEKQHPFYVIRYAILQNQQEFLASVARYVHTNQGGRVQFLEPDLKKIHTLPQSMEHLNQLERLIKQEGAQLVQKRNDA
ncbi:hypothetical protein [Thermoflavimicrobium dichotomicum]|uniref:Uncharacterized protein n=1 Tax=Thermoflavimicrobium dichotomicum TaxID=46223 RepID=A0A1I3RIM2_9BACL|nr:hypothetical protein [Thermoflavimicrobium dichotomicum]SFJ45890.1 hypothetical protein SAMN05421852_11035 [Thermoflavimicrobium dichotomicum]